MLTPPPPGKIWYFPSERTIFGNLSLTDYNSRERRIIRNNNKYKSIEYSALKVPGTFSKKSFFKNPNPHYYQWYLNEIVIMNLWRFK